MTTPIFTERNEKLSRQATGLTAHFSYNDGAARPLYLNKTMIRKLGTVGRK